MHARTIPAEGALHRPDVADPAEDLEREHGRQERRRGHVTADLLEQDRELDRAEPTPPSASGTAIPSQPCSTMARPQVTVPTLRGLGHPAHPGRRREVVEERPGAVTERELVLREVEIHRASDTI